MNKSKLIWAITELLDTVKFQGFADGSFNISKHQMGKLEELIDELYIAEDSD